MIYSLENISSVFHPVAHTHSSSRIIIGVLSFYEQLSHKKTPEGGDTEFKLIQN